jgi:hypothetical protein
MTIKLFVLVFAVLYSINGHGGGIYKCTDANGHALYSDTACSTEADRQAIEVSPIQEAPHASFFSALTEKIRGFIKSFSIDRTTSSELSTNAPSDIQQTYQCDGRTYCSQMTSCEEATFFINNCPDTKMDGNNDGVPCESQWCR